MARMATRNPDDALDLVQDAMFKLVQNYRDRPEEEWPPLFYRILQSRIRDWARREGVRGRFRLFLGGRDDDRDPIQQLGDPRGRAPDQLLEGRQQTEAIGTAVAALPLRQQQVFMLRAWEGLSVIDTAQAMGCSQGSVKTHYHRAVKALRDKLGAYWP